MMKDKLTAGESMKLIQMLILAASLSSALSYGGTSGSFDDDDDDTPPPAKKIVPKPESKTEATYTHRAACPDGRCDRPSKSTAEQAPKVKSAAIDTTTRNGSCTDRILRSMRNEASCWSSYGSGGCGVYPAKGKHGRGPFRGSCGRAVASGLTRAGINNGSTMGNAKDMGASLRALGFVNIKEPGMTPSTAPVGSILVYGAATIRGCRGLGSIYGHVEAKDYGGRYIYDGAASHNIQVKMGAACRPLIGVYWPTNVRGC